MNALLFSPIQGSEGQRLSFSVEQDGSKESALLGCYHLPISLKGVCHLQDLVVPLTGGKMEGQLKLRVTIIKS